VTLPCRCPLLPLLLPLPPSLLLEVATAAARCLM
jgi:hypothetical protein